MVDVTTADSDSSIAFHQTSDDGICTALTAAEDITHAPATEQHIFV